MSLVEVLVALVIVVGLVGIVVPVLPGTILVLAAVLGWAVHVGTGAGWVVLALVVALLATGAVVKFTLPGRQLRDAGVPRSTLWVGAAVGVVGFFVIPVVGLFAGFVLGVYAMEARRLGTGAAWPSTVRALKAVGLSILVELAAALLATAVWATGVVVT